MIDSKSDRYDSFKGEATNDTRNGVSHTRNPKTMARHHEDMTCPRQLASCAWYVPFRSGVAAFGERRRSSGPVRFDPLLAIDLSAFSPKSVRKE
jgi:hypothetical protein